MTRLMNLTTHYCTYPEKNKVMLTDFAEEKITIYYIHLYVRIGAMCS